MSAVVAWSTTTPCAHAVASPGPNAAALASPAAVCSTSIPLSPPLAAGLSPESFSSPVIPVAACVAPPTGHAVLVPVAAAPVSDDDEDEPGWLVARE